MRTARLAIEKTDSPTVLPPRSFIGAFGESAVGKPTYGEQLTRSQWRRRRQEKLDLENGQCENCGEAEPKMHVHHIKYFKDRLAWEYADDELEVLCPKCHTVEHKNRKLLTRLLATIDISEAVGLLGGYLAGQDEIDESLANVASEVYGPAYDLGIMASIASGYQWKRMAEASAVLKKGRRTRPQQLVAIERWSGANEANHGNQA